jgi:tetratricopeptide (TPR) repeat protein
VVYQYAGRLKDAIPLLETALERGRKRPDGLPAALAWAPGALANSYEQTGQFAKAEAIHRDTLERTKQKFGSDDPHTAHAMAWLGYILLTQKKYTEAERVLRQALTIEDQKEPDVWTTFNTRSLLGAALMGQKKYAEAEPLLLQGYQGLKRRQDKIPAAYRQSRLQRAQNRLVQLYEAIGKQDEAAKWRKQ